MAETVTTDILDRLVGFESVYTRADYAAITDYACAHLADHGFTVHRLTGARAGRAGLFASLGPAGRGGILLSAHLDVVPVEGQAWSVDPFRMSRRNGRLYGRGTTDMKGFAAAALALAARAADRELRDPLKIALSYDEEAGCVGMAEMIDRLDDTIGTPSICLVGEPTSMRIATGHKGKLSYRVRCRGSAGHSASAPHYANALHIAGDVVALLRQVQADLATAGARDDAYDVPYTTVHVGTLSGGASLNVVPDRAELEFEIRHTAADDPARILASIERDIAELDQGWRARHPTAGIEIEPINAYPGLDTPTDAAVTRFVEGLGGITPPTKVSFGTEAGFFAERWRIPTIVCGPGDMEQGHKPDEFIEEGQLAACDAMLDRILGRLTG